MNSEKQPVVLSAVEFEVAHLRSLRPDWEYRTFGIGAIESARQIVKLIETLANRHIIYLGTCGIFGDFTGIELFSTRECRWVPPCIRQGLSWKIDGVDEDIIIPERQVGRLVHQLPKGTVICSSTISQSPAFIDAPTEPQEGPILENLELFSVLPMLLKHSESLDIILATTNAIGPSARNEWRQNFKNAAKVTGDFIHKSAN